MTTGGVAVILAAALCVPLASAAAVPTESPGDRAVLVGRWDDGGRGHPLAVAVSGTVAYLAAGRNLKVLDVSDSATPVLLARLELPITGGCCIYDIAVVGPNAFLATIDGLRVVDVSNPSAPRVVGSTEEPATTVAISGSYAYLAGGGYPFRVVDISDPTAPVAVSSNPPISSGLRGLAATGAYVYVSDGSRLRIVDVSNPVAPVEVGSYAAFGAWGVQVAGSLAYVVTSPALLVLDVSDPSAPSLVGRYARSAGLGGNMWDDLALSGDHLFVSSSIPYNAEQGLIILDVSDPTLPGEVGRFDVPYGLAVAVTESRAYLAVDDVGLVVVDVSSPAAPTAMGSFGTRAGQASKVVISGPRAYVGDATGPIYFAPLYADVHILDASNPAEPGKLGSYRLPRTPRFGFPYLWSFAVAGTHAYFGSDTDGLRIVDVSDPEAPAEVGRLDTPGRATGVAVSGSFAYVADYTGGLRIADVSDATAPVEIGSFDAPYQDRASSVEVHGNHAFVLDTNFVLSIVDVADPAHPVWANAVDGGYGLDAAGSLLYVANPTFGLRILDVSDPSVPLDVAPSVSDLRNASDVAVVGSVAYVTDHHRGLIVLDVSNPASPREIASYPAPGATAVAVQGDYVYVAAGFDGLYVIVLDSDDDGIGDPADACPHSNRAESVVLGHCDSGVPNTLFENGCTIADRIDTCSGGASNHGRSVSCVGALMQRLRGEGAISRNEQGRIHRCAAMPPPRDLVTPVTPGIRVPEFVWALQPHAPASEGSNGHATALVVDGTGNVITVGTFWGALDFDPGPGAANLTGGGAFIAKLDPDGGLVWAKRIAGTDEASGGLYPVSVAVDDAGNVHVQGNYSGDVDFDPGPGTSTLEANGGYSACVVKLDAEGGFAWAGRTGGLALDWFSGPAVAVDGSGNVVTVGSFWGTEDFDPGPGTHNLSADAFVPDLFVSKLDRDGRFVWARSMHSLPDLIGNSGVYGGSIAVDGAGDVHIAGGFSGAVDFDPGPDEYRLTSGYSMFVSKLDAAGAFLWARGVDVGSVEGHDLAIDGSGNVYASGPFYGTVDLDPGPDTYSLSEVDGTRFLAKFDAAGEFVWGTTDPTYGPGNLADITVDGGGNVYSIGSIDASGVDRTFCRKRDTHGNVVWDASIGRTGSPYPGRLALGPRGSVHILGSFHGSADFDPGPGTFEMTSESGTNYLLKLGPPDGDDDGIRDENDACPDSVTTPTVVLGVCDSGVPNALLPDGCTIVDRLAPCDGAENWGHQSGCVASVANELKQEGVLSTTQSSRIRQCAAKPASHR